MDDKSTPKPTENHPTQSTESSEPKKKVGRPRKHPVKTEKRPRGRPKKEQMKVVDDELDMIAQLKAEIAELKSKSQETVAKVEILDKTQKKADVGVKEYGVGDWSSHVSGADKGYKRSIYVDMRTTILPRAY